MRYLILLLFTLSFISCGPLNTINTNNSDGIYGNKAEIASNNGTFYKNYFEQKSDELGINSSINDSIKFQSFLILNSLFIINYL